MRVLKMDVKLVVTKHTNEGGWIDNEIATSKSLVVLRICKQNHSQWVEISKWNYNKKY